VVQRTDTISSKYEKGNDASLADRTLEFGEPIAAEISASQQVVLNLSKVIDTW